MILAKMSMLQKEKEKGRGSLSVWDKMENEVIINTTLRYRDELVQTHFLHLTKSLLPKHRISVQRQSASVWK